MANLGPQDGRRREQEHKQEPMLNRELKELLSHTLSKIREVVAGVSRVAFHCHAHSDLLGVCTMSKLDEHIKKRCAYYQMEGDLNAVQYFLYRTNHFGYMAKAYDEIYTMSDLNGALDETERGITEMLELLDDAARVEVHRMNLILMPAVNEERSFASSSALDALRRMGVSCGNAQEITKLKEAVEGPLIMNLQAAKILGKHWRGDTE